MVSYIDSIPPEIWMEVLDYTSDGILITDATGRILTCNQAWISLCSTLPRTDTIGSHVYTFERNWGMSNTAASAVLKNKKESVEIMKCPNGKTILSAGKPVFDETGVLRYVIVNVKDLSEVLQLRQKLHSTEEVKAKYLHWIQQRVKLQDSQPIVASRQMEAVYKKCMTLSGVDVTVLILGESGTGKEVIAKFIHANSRRKDKPFLSINCGAIPESLLESELFGYVSGAFTGASKAGKKGIFEAADGGTLLLDEIGEISPEMQVKLLRVLETKQITRIGSTTPIDIDVRILAATNRNLLERSQQGLFRSDLYYRINVINILLPPLRERPEDISALALHYLKLFNLQYLCEKTLGPEALQTLSQYAWPGNVRELRNMMEQLVILSETNEITREFILTILGNAPESAPSIVSVNQIAPLEEVVAQAERQLLERVAKTQRSSRKIAQVLGCSQTTVCRKLRKYGIAFDE